MWDITLPLPPPKKKNRFISLHCKFAQDIILFAQTTVKYFISSITQRCLSNYFRTSCPLFRWREGRTTYRTTKTSHIPSFLPNSGAWNELRLCETRNSLARVPRARQPSWKIPPRYPFCFRRMVCLSSRDIPSTLKVIFRRPENVKPSAVSKRSLRCRGVAGSFKVS